MNCIIVDDEPLAREGMQAMIQEVSNLEIIGTFSNALAAADFLKTQSVDLIFLDIQMPKVTGLEFAEQLPEETLVVFTTAFSQYAVKSYELNAIGYLLKPIDKNRLKKVIEKAITYKQLLSKEVPKNTFEKSTDDFMFIKSERRFYKVLFSEILFIEGLKDYVVIYTATQKLITAMNLKTAHQKIAVTHFLRVSKSYVVNTQFIDSFDHHTLYVGEHEIPLGEVYKKDFLKYFSEGSLSSDNL